MGVEDLPDLLCHNGEEAPDYGQSVGHLPKVTEFPFKSHGKCPLLGEIYQPDH